MLFPCIILCRKGSKSLKNKNISKLGNLSIFEITKNYAKKSKYVTHIVVSTDDKKIYNQAKKDCFVIFPRPKKISGDRASTESALKHALKVFEENFGKADYVSYLQVTEPFRPPKILDKCYAKILKNKKIDSCFAAFEQKKNFWKLKNQKMIRVTDKRERYKPRQQKKTILREDTGVALVTKSKFIRKGERVGNNISCVKYSKSIYNLDINYPEDFKLAKLINKNFKF
tara:strand:+ start:1536 stop:2219 length:684 start_codon:yes stop_codon:yes gene_type:complete